MLLQSSTVQISGTGCYCRAPQFKFKEHDVTESFIV